MRFSTVASSAVLFGAAAMAAPGYNVVYETEVATITSCPSYVTDCPGKHSPTAPVYPPTTTPCSTHIPVYPPPTYPSEVPVYPPVESSPVYPPPTYPSEVPVYPPVESSPVYPPPTYPSEVPVYPPVASSPVYPPPSYSTAVPVYPSPSPVCPGGEYCPPTYVPTGTGYPVPPMNTSTPYYPPPPVYTGAASAKSFSLVAVIAAAGAVFLA